MKRPIPKGLRFRVFERDGFRCRYCGRNAEDTVLHADHRTPESLGGPTTLENLVTACVACNSGKGTAPLGRFIPLQREAAIAADLFQRCLERFGRFMDAVEAWDVIYNECMCSEAPEFFYGCIQTAPTWRDARRSILREAGYPVDAWPTTGDVL